MSHKSQEKNMRKLAELLSQDLGYIWGEKESGPNGAKKQFLNTGRVFLRALAKDLGLMDAKVDSNAGGIGLHRRAQPVPHPPGSGGDELPRPAVPAGGPAGGEHP